MTRQTKLGVSCGSQSVGTPPHWVDGFWYHLLNCSENRFFLFLVFWNEKSLIRRTLWFLDLFHVSIVDFEVGLCKNVGFACVISELVGGLPDLG